MVAPRVTGTRVGDADMPPELRHGQTGIPPFFYVGSGWTPATCPPRRSSSSRWPSPSPTSRLPTIPIGLTHATPPVVAEGNFTAWRVGLVPQCLGSLTSSPLGPTCRRASGVYAAGRPDWGAVLPLEAKMGAASSEPPCAFGVGPAVCLGRSRRREHWG